MNAAAKAVMNELPDIFIGYGISDEYRYQAAYHIIYTERQSWKLMPGMHSFVFHKTCDLFERRSR